MAFATLSNMGGELTAEQAESAARKAILLLEKTIGNDAVLPSAGEMGIFKIHEYAGRSYVVIPLGESDTAVYDIGAGTLRVAKGLPNVPNRGMDDSAFDVGNEAKRKELAKKSPGIDDFQIGGGKKPIIVGKQAWSGYLSRDRESLNSEECTMEWKGKGAEICEVPAPDVKQGTQFIHTPPPQQTGSGGYFVIVRDTD